MGGAGEALPTFRVHSAVPDAQCRCEPLRGLTSRPQKHSLQAHGLLCSSRAVWLWAGYLASLSPIYHP